MMKVGITGGIGSGKSTVCRLFAQKAPRKSGEKTICLSSSKMVYDRTIGKQFFR